MISILLPAMVAMVLVLFAFAALSLILPRRRRAAVMGHYRHRPLMTDNELEFFGRLVAALPQHYVFPQVAMSALLEPTSANKATRHADRLRVAQQRVDYVVCNKSCEVIAVVELDDRTHRQAKERTRDERLGQGGIRTIRFEARAKPAAGVIRDTVLASTAQANGGTAEPADMLARAR